MARRIRSGSQLLETIFLRPGNIGELYESDFMKASKSGNQLELATFVLALLVLFFSLATVVYLLPPTTPGSARSRLPSPVSLETARGR